MCTGNICRSPMGELLLPRFLPDPAITADSAGTHGLPQHPIDPNSARILAHSQIDANTFRSKRITPQIADDADLILGFEPHHISEVVSLAPRKSQRAFLLTDFANICAYCAQHDLLSGATQPERLISAATHASLIRPLLPSPKAIRASPKPSRSDSGSPPATGRLPPGRLPVTARTDNVPYTRVGHRNGGPHA